MHPRQLVGLAFLAFAVFVVRVHADTLVTSPGVLSLGWFSWPSVYSVEETGSSVARSLRIGASAKDGGDDEDRAGLSVPVAEKIKTFFSSSKVAPEQLQKWLNNGKSADAVFARMRLDKAESLLLYSDDFNNWLKYVDDLSAKYPTKGTSAITTLTAHYGDAELYRMIQSALSTPRTKELATKLQAEQMKHWINAAKEPDDVFRLMKLDQVNRNILGNQEFVAWAKYVDDLNAKYPEKVVTMVPTLRKYHSDSPLFQMAQAGMRVKETKIIATKLQGEMIQAWLRSRKTPENAMSELGIGRSVGTLLENPMFSSWAKYTDAYNLKYRQKPTTMIEAITRRFDEVDVAKMLAKAKTDDATRSIATKLESAQLKMWRNRGESVDDVLHLLGLRMIVDFAGNPLFRTWVSYMNILAKANPGTATVMLSKLETRFNDRALNQILREATKFPSMEKAATKIQTQKIRDYAASNQVPMKVFKWLDLDNLGDDLLVDPLFTKWMKYANDFSKKNPGHQESLFAPIRTWYNPEPIKRMIRKAMQNPSSVGIAKLMERERSNYWLDNKDLPRRVFRDLDLEKAGYKTLSSSNFEVWVKYLNDFNHRYPEGKTTMIDSIRANYNDIHLLGILDAAKKGPRTEKLATKLQNALVDKWVAEKEPLSALKRRFHDLPGSKETLEKYAAKLNALAGNAS